MSFWFWGYRGVKTKLQAPVVVYTCTIIADFTFQADRIILDFFSKTGQKEYDQEMPQSWTTAQQSLFLYVFSARSKRMSIRTWIQALWHSYIFLKRICRKSQFWKKSSRQQKIYGKFLHGIKLCCITRVMCKMQHFILLLSVWWSFCLCQLMVIIFLKHYLWDYMFDLGGRALWGLSLSTWLTFTI